MYACQLGFWVYGVLFTKSCRSGRWSGPNSLGYLAVYFNRSLFWGAWHHGQHPSIFLAFVLREGWGRVEEWPLFCKFFTWINKMKIAKVNRTIIIPKNVRIMLILKSSLLADKKFLLMAVIIFKILLINFFVT